MFENFTYWFFDNLIKSVYSDILREYISIFIIFSILFELFYIYNRNEV